MGSALTAYMGNREKFFRRMWNRAEMIGKVLAHTEELSRLLNEGPRLHSSPVRRLALKLKGVELFCLLLRGAGKGEEAKKIAAIANENQIFSTPPEPLLTGRHGIELGIAPGPELGKLMKECFEAQLDGAFATLEEGKRYLKNLIAKKRQGK